MAPALSPLPGAAFVTPPVQVMIGGSGTASRFAGARWWSRALILSSRVMKSSNLDLARCVGVVVMGT